MEELNGSPPPPQPASMLCLSPHVMDALVDISEFLLMANDSDSENNSSCSQKVQQLWWNCRRRVLLLRRQQQQQQQQNYTSLSGSQSNDALEGGERDLEIGPVTWNTASSPDESRSPSSPGLRRRSRSSSGQSEVSSAGGSSFLNSSGSFESSEDPGSTFDDEDEGDSSVSLSASRSRSNPLPASAVAARVVANAQVQRNNNAPPPSSPAADGNDTNNSLSPSRGGLCTQTSVHFVMRACFVLGWFHLACLFLLHSTYVGHPTLLPVHVLVSNNNSDNHEYRMNMTEQQLMKQHPYQTCIEAALATRPPEERSQYFSLYGDADDDDEVEGDEEDYDLDKADNVSKEEKESANDTKIKKKESESSGIAPLLGQDEVLQIKVLYGGSCTGQCSRVRPLGSTLQDEEKNGQWNHPRFKKHNSTTDPCATEDFWEEPHYRYSMHEALLYLDTNVQLMHNLTLVNVTLTEACLATGSDDMSQVSWGKRVAQVLTQVFGVMDCAIVNQLMYGITNGDRTEYRDGHLIHVQNKERWSWRKHELPAFARPPLWSWQRFHTNPIPWFFGKIGDLLSGLLTFFLITSITALIVRVLTSSGVVMMVPLFACFRVMGLPGASDRILALSYPWIGRARAAIQRRRVGRDSHLVASHLAKIFLYYSMYEGCQAAWSVLLYGGKSIPEGVPIVLFGFCMIWEYFSMVFVRSALSVRFFPRVTLLYFLLYHFYFYSVPYGYFDVAMIPLFLFMIQAMLYTVLAYELPAATRGAVSIECPREVYNRLAWPEWSAGLPHEWTLFLPLNSRFTPLYDQLLVTDAENDGTNVDGDHANNDGIPLLPPNHPPSEGTEETSNLNSSIVEEGERTVSMANNDGVETVQLTGSSVSSTSSLGLHSRRSLTSE
eukprot:CAMPEP_0198283350 /NCGR_PEP_ID=MMETSP1449-20131203/2972_1 /TAXON_ID=420275 /ORGANISM="Attheya septentrionalis, Strain CCMP2084" /LENGTH=887 /DNA_ID=CAMNT_0043979935 /DNA_START=171 /DNA_END=2834 /DNA_ORIENTATION=-